MASNAISFTINANTNNAVYSVKELNGVTEQLAITAANTGKTYQNTISNILPQAAQKLEKGSKQMKKATEGIWAPLKNFGIWIRSLHIYGLDGLTKGFAKLGSTILGSFINPITVAATALMGLSIGIRKWYNNTHDSMEEIIKKNQNMITASNQRIEKFNEQAKAVKGLIDQLKELSKAEPFGKIQSVISQNILAQIQSKIPNLVVKRDENGRVTNSVQIQNQYDEYVRQQNRKAAVENRDTLLNLLNFSMGKLTGKGLKEEFFTKGAGELGNLNKQGQWAITKLINGDTNILQKLKLQDFVFGNTEQRQKWAQQAGFYSTNQDNKAVWKEIEDLLGKLLEEEKKITKYSMATQAVSARQQEVRTKQRGLQAQYAKNVQADEKLAVEQAKQAQDQYIQSLNDDRQRAEYYSKKSAALHSQAEAARDKVSNIDKELTDMGLKFNDEGQLQTSGLRELLNTQKQFAELYKKEQALRNARQEQLRRRVGPLYKELQPLKDQVDEIERLKNTGFGGDENIRWKARDERIKQEYRSKKAIIEGLQKSINDDYDKQLTKTRSEFNRKNYNLNLSLWQKQSDKIDEGNKKLEERLKLVSTIGEKNKQSADALKKQAQFIEKANKADEAAADAKAKAAQEQKQKYKAIENFYKKYGDPIKEQMYKEQGMQKQWKRLQYMEQMADLNEQVYGDSYLTPAQEQLAKQMAELDYLKSISQQFNPSNPQYSVKTNSLAERGGFASSIVVDGLANIDKQQLKTMKQSESLLNSISETQGRVLSLLENVMRY